MKKFFESKTIWASALVTILPLIMQLFSPENLEAWGVNPYIISLLGILFGWLRTITTKPIK